MSMPVRVFVVEPDCGRLISLLLWLDQFAEIEVTGSCGQVHEMTSQQMQNTDVVMIDLESQEVQSVTALRALKASAQVPATLVLCKAENSAIDKAITAEADGVIKPNANLSELLDSLLDSVRRAYNRRKLQTSAAKVPLTKAG